MKFLRRPTKMPPAASVSAPRNPGDTGGKVLGRVLERAGQTASELFDVVVEPGARDVRDRLLRHGASLDYAARIIQSVLKTGARGAWAIDSAAVAIGESVPIHPSPRRRKGTTQPHFFVFVGPTGSGKTTTLAKLGRKLTEAGRNVVYASFDAAGTSALERVGGAQADVDRLELPLVTVRSAADLVGALRRHPAAEIVLLDTPGLSPRDTKRLRMMAREIDRVRTIGPTETYLVLPATKSRSAVALVCEAFAGLDPDACILTKLDETNEPMMLLEAVTRAALPVAFLCDGLDTRGHLSRPNADRIADLALRGKC